MIQNSNQFYQQFKTKTKEVAIADHLDALTVEQMELMLLLLSMQQKKLKKKSKEFWKSLKKSKNKEIKSVRQVVDLRKQRRQLRNHKTEECNGNIQKKLLIQSKMLLPIMMIYWLNMINYQLVNRLQEMLNINWKLQN